MLSLLVLPSVFLIFSVIIVSSYCQPVRRDKLHTELSLGTMKESKVLYLIHQKPLWVNFAQVRSAFPTITTAFSKVFFQNWEVSLVSKRTDTKEMLQVSIHYSPEKNTMKNFERKKPLCRIVFYLRLSVERLNTVKEQIYRVWIGSLSAYLRFFSQPLKKRKRKASNTWSYRGKKIHIAIDALSVKWIFLVMTLKKWSLLWKTKAEGMFCRTNIFFTKSDHSNFTVSSLLVRTVDAWKYFTVKITWTVHAHTFSLGLVLDEEMGSFFRAWNLTL